MVVRPCDSEVRIGLRGAWIQGCLLRMHEAFPQACETSGNIRWSLRDVERYDVQARRVCNKQQVQLDRERAVWSCCGEARSLSVLCKLPRVCATHLSSRVARRRTGGCMREPNGGRAVCKHVVCSESKHGRAVVNPSYPERAAMPLECACATSQP